MATKGTTVKIVAEFDGQVSGDDVLAIARQAVVALADVYRVTVTAADGATAFATAEFDIKSNKVVAESGRTK